MHMLVTINYVDGYKNEYSLDATNWNSYTGPVNITEKGTTTYKIFSVYNINKEDNYIDNNFKDFNKMINIFKNRSEINFHENIENINQLITLSTCHSNNKDRIVVHGYKKK